jgi:hypothetical protein
MKMRKAVGAGLFSILALSMIGGQAFGWGNTWMGAGLEQAINGAPWKIGILRYYAAFQLNNAGYDSDIYFGMFEKRVPDWTLSAGPDLRVLLPLKNKVVFDISESPRYLFFLKTDRERAWNNAFSGNVHVVLNRFYFQAGAEWSNVKERLSTELNMNIRLKDETLSGLMFWQPSRGTSFALRYQKSKFTYENQTSESVNIGEALNRTESFLDLLAYLQQQSNTRIYLDAQYGSYVFAQRTASSGRDSRSYGISGGVQFLPPATGFRDETSGIRGNISVGYKLLDVLDPLRKDYSGLAGNVGVSTGIMKLTAFRLFFSMGPQFSTYTVRTYYLQTTVGAGLSRALSRKVLLTYDFGYGRNSYPAGETETGTPLEKFADRYTTHAVQLNVRLRRDLQISLLGNMGRRHSEISIRPVSSRAFIGLSLTYGYPGGGGVMPAGPFF